MTRLLRLIAASAVVALAAGCASRGPLSRPPATTPGNETASPSGPRAPRVAVIDLTRAMRVHPRWPEMTALDREISGLQARIVASVENRPGPLQIELPRVDLTPEMRAAADRMRPEFTQQADAIKEAARKELEAFVAQLRAEQQKKVDARRTELEAGLTKAAQDKQQALNTDNQQFQQQTMAEYRLPLLNLKLKLEDIQQSDKGQADKLSAQQQALTKERDDKIAAHEKANLQALQDFQKDQVQASNAQLKAYQDELAKDGQRQVDVRAAQLTGDVRTKLDTLQSGFNQRLRQQQVAIVSTAREAQTQEVDRMKTQAQRQIQAEVAKVRALQDELQAAERGRARLYGAILADLRIEAAALAQEKGWDMVLTQTIAAPGTVDGTDELIARLRR